MADIHGLKNEARRQEQRENWNRAIDLYSRAIQRSEKGDGGPIDLSLYNRLGDLHRRRGNIEAAVTCYECAIEGYAGQQLYANATALCNKVLRIAPERTEIYLRLGRLSAGIGLYAKARGDYLMYAERMSRQGRLDEALTALDEFARSSGQTDIRSEFSDRLRRAGLFEESDRVDAGGSETAGNAKGAVIVSPAAADEPASPEPTLPKEASESLREVLAEFPARVSRAGELPVASQAEESPVASPAAAPPDDDPDELVRRAETQLADGERALGIGALQCARDLYDRDRRLVEACRVLGRLLELLPDDAALHRQRVDYAFKANDRGALVVAYLDLAACLQRQGRLRAARSVYIQLLDVSPGHEMATTRIAELDEEELLRERRNTPSATASATQDKAAEAPDFDTILHELWSGDKPGAPASPRDE